MYNIGTVSTTANSPKITGTGTRWKDNTTLISVGQVVLIENGSNLLINSIYSIESNTALTLAFPISAKLTNAKYIILTTMIDSISDGVNKATAQVIASEIFTDIFTELMTGTGIIEFELPNGQKVKLRTENEKDKQLDGKLDKSGGQITKNDQALAIKVAGENQANYIGFLDASGYRRGLVGYGNTTDDFAISNTRSGITLKLTANGKALIGSAEIVKVGDYGIGTIDGMAIPNKDYNDIQRNGFYAGPGGVADILNKPPQTTGGNPVYGAAIMASRNSNEAFLIAGHRSEVVYRAKTSGVWSDTYLRFYTTANTTKDSNGNLKAASPIVKVFADHIENNDESEGVTLKKLHTGIYQLHGVLGLHSDASWGGINGGITIPCGINQLPLVYALYDVLEKGKPHPFDGRIVEPDEDGDIVLYTTYRKHDLPQNIQYERFKLYPEFLKEVDGEKVELTPGEPCDIPVGHWVDVRVNMPSNSIYNQKQAEAERLAKIEAERLAQEEAKHAAEEAERADQEAAERKQNEVIEN
ncbi:TPA: hypothetical protein P1K35_002122 [Providencia rettgeri]